MATARVWTCVDVPGAAPFGSRSAPKELSVSGAQLDVTKSLGIAATWNVWDNSHPAVQAFNLLVIQSSADGVLVELTTDRNGSYGTRVYTVELVANLPLVLGSDGSMANYTADFGGGTMSVIDRIRVRSPSNTATVRVGIYN